MSAGRQPGPGEGCLLALRYFGIFRFPLTATEVFLYHPEKTTEDQVRLELHTLTETGRVFYHEGYYMTGPTPEWVAEREASRERALQLLARSGRYASVIAAFPFVRGVAISGSLSKFSASLHPDIDYFIITDANRLWIARSLLHLFKKLTFITGHQHYFCMNYFVDADALAITHRNRYTAIETVTLLPAWDEDILGKFHEVNSWTLDHLPNHPGCINRDYLLKFKKRPCKMVAEQMIGLLAPDKLNRALMRLTDRKWRRKWRRAGYAAEEYERAFLTNLHISKNHPHDFEKKVLTELSRYA